MRPADADLAARDQALPGLPVLLDDDLLAAWLASRGLAPARRRYLRYKPGTGCLLALDLRVDGGAVPVVLQAASADSAPKLAKTRAQAPPGSVLAVDEARCLLLTTERADRDLPAIARLAEPHGTAAVLGRLLPGRDLTGAVLRRLRYKPARRWVAVLGQPGHDPLLLRVHRPAVTAELLSALTALGTARVPTPGLVAADPDLGLAVVEWLPGHPLAAVPAAERAPLLRATGRVVARLHQHPARRLRRRDAGAARDSARAAADLVGRLLPEHAGRARDLASAIGARLRPAPAPRVCHGDLSADQVVVGPAGPALVDLDEVALDDPAVDLASVVAGAQLDEVGHPGDVDPLLAGYATVRPLPPARHLAAHTAAALLRRAPEPFRRAEPAWAAGVLRGLEAAERALS